MKQRLSETASFPLLLRTALVQKLRRTNDPWLEHCLLQLQLIQGFAGRLHSGLAAARAGSIMLIMLYNVHHVCNFPEVIETTYGQFVLQITSLL